jgi:hypothetical protein
MWNLFLKMWQKNRYSPVIITLPNKLMKEH